MTERIDDHQPTLGPSSGLFSEVEGASGVARGAVRTGQYLL